MEFRDPIIHEMCRFSVTIIEYNGYDNEGELIETFENLEKVLPSRKKLLGQWPIEEDVRKNIKKAYRIKMAELMARY